VLDVHPPHETVHGVRDFILHLTTITIGLLIALSLEGLVEWQHHRHLVHDAEASLHAEIKGNAEGLQGILDDVHKREAALKDDVSVLTFVAAKGKYPTKRSMTIEFRIVTFDDVSWKTAQTTGALEYMPYDLAKEYSGIYAQQALLTASEQQAARDAVVSIGPFLNGTDSDAAPIKEVALALIEKIEVVQGQLLLVDSFMKGLNAQYKQYLTAHPN